MFQEPDVKEGIGKDVDEALNDGPSPAVGKELPTPNERLQELLQEIGDYSPETATDVSLASLTWRDFPALRRAKAKLSVQSKDKTIDVFFRARISAMIGDLSLYLDPSLSYDWQESSMLAAKVSGHGVYHARCI